MSNTRIKKELLEVCSAKARVDAESKYKRFKASPREAVLDLLGDLALGDVDTLEGAEIQGKAHVVYEMARDWLESLENHGGVL